MTHFQQIEEMVENFLKAKDQPVEIQDMASEIARLQPGVRSFEVKQAAIALVSRGHARITKDWRITEVDDSHPVP